MYILHLLLYEGMEAILVYLPSLLNQKFWCLNLG